MKIYKNFIYTKFNLKQHGSQVKKATWSYTDKVLSYKHIQVNKNTHLNKHTHTFCTNTLVTKTQQKDTQTNRAEINHGRRDH